MAKRGGDPGTEKRTDIKTLMYLSFSPPGLTRQVRIINTYSTYRTSTICPHSATSPLKPHLQPIPLELVKSQEMR